MSVQGKEMRSKAQVHRSDVRIQSLREQYNIAVIPRETCTAATPATVPSASLELLVNMGQIAGDRAYLISKRTSFISAHIQTSFVERYDFKKISRMFSNK